MNSFDDSKVIMQINDTSCIMFFFIIITIIGIYLLYNLSFYTPKILPEKKKIFFNLSIILSVFDSGILILLT